MEKTKKRAASTELHVGLEFVFIVGFISFQEEKKMKWCVVHAA